VPVAPIAKVGGVPSNFGGYSVADTFSNDRIDAIRQRTCQGCLSWTGFFVPLYRFKVIDPQSSPKLPKNQFLEKSYPLTEEFLNFTTGTKGFTSVWIHVFLASFAKLGIVEATKRVRGIRHEKKVGILSISLWLL